MCKLVVNKIEGLVETKSTEVLSQVLIIYIHLICSAILACRLNISASVANSQNLNRYKVESCMLIQCIWAIAFLHVMTLVPSPSPQIDMEVEVKKLCQVAGPLNAACRSFIDQYFDQIWKMVTKELVRIRTLLILYRSVFRQGSSDCL